MRRILAIILSVLIMGVIFSRIDLKEFQHYLAGMSVGLFLLALLFFIPQVALSAYRWQVMIRKRVRLSLWESSKLVLACCALNILIPSRVGDLSKAYFIGREGKVEMKRGMNVVFFEKYIDLASLGVVTLTGILFQKTWDGPTAWGLLYSLTLLGIFPVLYFINLERIFSRPLFERSRWLRPVKIFFEDTQAYLNELKKEPKELAWILTLSVFLWFLHLLQFYVLFQSLHSAVSLANVFRLVPLAILVGLVPVTVAGVGTRDSAMIYFFAPYESASLMAGVGLFASLRYFVPGIVGLPFLNHYVVKKVESR